mgnify:FL=1
MNMGSFNASSCYDQAVANMMSTNYGGLLSAAFGDPMRSLFGVRNLPGTNGTGNSNNGTSAATAATNNQTGSSSNSNQNSAGGSSSEHLQAVSDDGFF